jgi:hypothetical protein
MEDAVDGVPEVCLLDPYGHMVGSLAGSGRARRHPGWDCYHTGLWTTRVDDRAVGLVTGGLGAAWAVLVARRLAGSGGRIVVSVSPALPVHPSGPLPRVVLIDRALRDEAVSAAHRPAARWSRLDPVVAARLARVGMATGAAWSTAAPCRGPAVALARAGTDRISCVDTEAAALYAYAEGGGPTVVCLAHLDATTTMTDRVVTWGPGVGADRLLEVATAVAALC